MKIKSKIWILFFIAFILFFNSLSGQEKSDSVKKFKNTIRFNLTNPMLFGDKYRVFGYERVVSRNQSFSVNAGKFSLPKFKNFNTDSIALKDNYTEKGYTVAVDYRFYLSKENKYPIPRGLYIGPYYSFNMLDRINTWTMNTADFNGELSTNIRLNANLIGFQMGYQFVIKNRIAIDMIFFGPGTWFYSVRSTTGTNLSDEDEELLYGKINEFLEQKLPGNDILIQPGETRVSGRYTTSSGGLRYLIQIGFRF